MMWAWQIWSSGLIPALRDSYYFVHENYTTPGDNTVSLPKAWRLIGPVIALSGLFNFGWTASAFVNMTSEPWTAPRSAASTDDPAAVNLTFRLRLPVPGPRGMFTPY